MYPQQAGVAAPQKPETFMLSTEAQQALPQDAQVALQQVDNLKYFLISAPVDWQSDQYIRRFLLPTGEYVSCVLWNNLFHISGTDIVRCLSFRFQAFGRPVKNSKKFEEGIFSDLRNLKSGTDASLEEPKSPFLDFLYKNNCIRTQKKQKVFYWYSVPHDRLFLDALERDLKREKMNQEATTVAVSEPALSFQYDSSQSLYEQLTKAQQANSSSFTPQQVSFAQPPAAATASPVMPSLDTMPPPPPQVMPQSMPPMADGIDAIVPYGAMPMPQPMPAAQHVKREPDFHPSNPNPPSARVQYNQAGVPVPAPQRHSSMPAYALEFSPAPSYVSSQYDDFGGPRGVSYEPITPPHQALGVTGEPAYIANEETGLYTAIPDHMAGVAGLNGMIQLPPSNVAGSQFPRNYGGNSNVYSVIEGSPTYKQRRRRSSIPPSMSVMAAAAATGPLPNGHRAADLRRSVSLSVGPLAESDEAGETSPPGLTYSVNSAMSMAGPHAVDVSRHGTPLSTVEGSPSLNSMTLQQQPQHGHDYPPLSNPDMPGDVAQPRPAGAAGPVRRARSATMMELGPYPQKSHSCPIPTCGRLFKRLEHLKRHRRTHDRPDGGDSANYNLSNDDEEFSGEDPMGSIEDASPTSENGYMTASLNSVANGSAGHSPNDLVPASLAPQSFNSLQTLSMPMTISQPHAINAGGMM